MDNPNAIRQMLDEPRVGELLAEWSRGMKSGRDIAPDVLARDQPELIDRLAFCIDQLKWNFFPQSGEPRTKSVPLKPGDEPLPGFILRGLLGRGAFGEVWSAQFGERTYALKIVRAGRHPHLEVEKEGLEQMKGASHPGVLRIRTVAMSQDSLCLVTELADETLGQRFKKLRVSESLLSLCARVVYSLRRIAEALDYLQAEKKLTHQDIKPSNLLSFDGIGKVGDFGSVRPIRRTHATEAILAESSGEGTVSHVFRSLDEIPWDRAFRPGATLFTASGACTPLYASPERIEGRNSTASDQYSLAVTIFELVTGAIPFPVEEHEQYWMRLVGWMNLEPLPKPLQPVFQRALSPRPQDRYESCVEFIDALRSALLPLIDPMDAFFLRKKTEDPGTPEVPSRMPRVARFGVLRIPFVHHFDRFGGRIARIPGWLFASCRTYHIWIALVLLAIANALIPYAILSQWMNRLSSIFSR